MSESSFPWRQFKRRASWRSVRNAASLLLSWMCAYDFILILRKSVMAGVTEPSLQITEHREGAAQIVDACRLVGQIVSRLRVQQRLDRGLVFYAAALRGIPVATTWLVPPGYRFVDEIGYSFVVPADGIWLRDVFVHTGYRGHRIFAKFCDGILTSFHPKARALWSDTDRRNAASLSAHTNHGFEIVASVWVLHVVGQFMLRSLPVDRGLLAGGYKPWQRVLLTGRGYRAYKAARLA